METNTHPFILLEPNIKKIIKEFGELEFKNVVKLKREKEFIMDKLFYEKYNNLSFIYIKFISEDNKDNIKFYIIKRKNEIIRYEFYSKRGVIGETNINFIAENDYVKEILRRLKFYIDNNKKEVVKDILKMAFGLHI